jgi:cytochrome c553
MLTSKAASIMQPSFYIGGMMLPRPPIVFVMIAASVVSYLLPPGTSLAAGDPKAGRKKALECQTCHGLDGVSKLPEAPHLSGQVEIYLVKALNDYKSGARTNEMMSLVASPLSDSDIADLAAWYSAIEITVQKPR